MKVYGKVNALQMALWCVWCTISELWCIEWAVTVCIPMCRCGRWQDRRMVDHGLRLLFFSSLMQPLHYIMVRNNFTVVNTSRLLPPSVDVSVQNIFAESVTWLVVLSEMSSRAECPHREPWILCLYSPHSNPYQTTRPPGPTAEAPALPVFLLPWLCRGFLD